VKFTERDLSPLAGMDKKQSGGKVEILLVGNLTLIKVENQTLVKESNFLIKEKCYSLKEQNTVVQKVK
jgi:hypothetical protein